MSDGIFNVYVGSEQIWDKTDVGRFPEEHEILEPMEKIVSAG